MGWPPSWWTSSHPPASAGTAPRRAVSRWRCRGGPVRGCPGDEAVRPVTPASHAKHFPSPGGPFVPGKNLTREEAAARAAVLRVDSYDVRLDLTTGPETFRTVTTARFACSEPGTDTFIDLIADSVERVTLNGTDLDAAALFADSRVALPGLAADNELYLYTQFEVPDSRRMYAVFEQPDLKGSFAFTVTAPAHWKVISNSPTPSPEPAGVADGVEKATWTFAPTPRISSYITALIAGPYDEVRDEVETRRGTVPLGVFCRKSLTQHLDADNIFDR